MINRKKTEDTKEVTRDRKSNQNIQYNGYKKRDKKRTMIYKTLHRQLKIEQLGPH